MVKCVFCNRAAKVQKKNHLRKKRYEKFQVAGVRPNFFDEKSVIPRKREEIKNTLHQVNYDVTLGGIVTL